MSSSPSGPSFTTGATLIRVHVGSTVKPEHLDETLEVYRALVSETLVEPGCVSYELLQLREDPCELMLVEQWLSQAHLDAHTHTPHFTTAMRRLEALETAEPARIYTGAL